MSDENLVGQTIAGKYRVEKVLGKGGMGLVVGARHLGLDEPVAIKVLRPAMMEVAGMVARFLREARAASKIKSEHVVRVTDVDTRDDGVPYMVMEHLTGTDFAEIRKEKGQLGVAEAVGWVIEACDAIAEAHELGIVHRDLKPSNLFLHTLRDGRRVVKVLDFGISKLETPGEMDTTKTGQMMGSPKYMSPEQMLSMRDVDARSDIWSMGAILYDLLCGRPPFVADSTPRICALVLNTDPALPSSLRPDLPRDLELIILRCLDKEADRRFADVRALMNALAPFAPPPEHVTSGTRSLVTPLPSSVILPAAREPAAMVASSPSNPSVTPTPSHGSAAPTHGPTVAAWDTTRYDGPARKSPPSRRAIVLGVGVLVVASAIGVYSARRPGPAPVPASTAAETASAPPPRAPVTVEPVKPAVNPSDLPDVEASGAPIAPKPLGAWPGGSGFVKKPKPGASADPFGGRRN